MLSVRMRYECKQCWWLSKVYEHRSIRDHKTQRQSSMYECFAAGRLRSLPDVGLLSWSSNARVCAQRYLARERRFRRAVCRHRAYNSSRRAVAYRSRTNHSPHTPYSMLQAAHMLCVQHLLASALAHQTKQHTTNQTFHYHTQHLWRCTTVSVGQQIGDHHQLALCCEQPTHAYMQGSLETTPLLLVLSAVSVFQSDIFHSTSHSVLSNAPSCSMLTACRSWPAAAVALQGSALCPSP